MKFQQALLVIFLTLIAVAPVMGQDDNENLVQFSGMILDGTDEQLYPVPYANIFVKESPKAIGQKSIKPYSPIGAALLKINSTIKIQK